MKVQEQLKQNVEEQNFNSKSRDVGKQVFEIFEEKGEKGISEAQEIFLDFIHQWLVGTTDYTEDVEIWVCEDCPKIHYTEYRKEYYNEHDIHSDYEMVEDEEGHLIGTDTQDMAETLFVYWKGDEPETKYRFELVPEEYIGEMNKRQFKNVVRNVLKDTVLSAGEEIIVDVAEFDYL